MAIDAIGNAVAGALGVPGAQSDASVSRTGSGPGFVDAVGRLVAGADAANRDANAAVAAMLDGSGEVHDAMIALQRADMTLQLTVQVRNKLVQAYQEIMRMPI